jgi:hypothetical protein
MLRVSGCNASPLSTSGRVRRCSCRCTSVILSYDGRSGRKSRTDNDDLSLQVLRNVRKRGDEASVKIAVPSRNVSKKTTK